ncbi:MAG: hypothetical protein H6Q68_1693 [Firmicutes bacterium]|nr:hypothetical protein [Bacillota bacterium]
MNKKAILSCVLIIVVAILFWTPYPTALALEFQTDVMGKDIVEWKDVVIPQDAVVDNVVVIGGNVTIAGTVKNEVIVINGNLTLQKTAQLSQRAFVIDGLIIQEEGAVVRKSFVNIRPDSANLTSFFFAGSMVLLLEFIKLAVGAFIVIIPPILVWSFQKKSIRLRIVCARYFSKNIALGVLSSFAFLIIETLLIISIVGIPLGILLGLLFLVGIIIGVSGLCMTIGVRIASRVGLIEKPNFIQVLCGSTAVALIINIPFAGVLVLLVAMLFGIGAVVMSLCRREDIL